MADAFTSDTYDALCQEAEGYLARGLAEQARELLLKAASLIGTRPKARSLLADACMSLGLWEEARSQLETLTTLEIDNFHNHFRLGQVLEELGENQLAQDNYNVVLEHNADHHGARVAISRLENSDDTADVNLASFFASDGGAAVEELPDVTESESVDSGEVVESVFGSTQVFPDDSGSEDVFAGEEDVERGVDKLLKDLGVEGDSQEQSGAVSELLESLGIRPDSDEEEVRETLKKVDISSLLGGDDEVAAAAAAVIEEARESETGGAAVLESVFAAEGAETTEEKATEATEPAVEAEGPADAEPAEEEPAAEPVPEPATEVESAVDVVESVFEAEQPEAEQETTEEIVTEPVQEQEPETPAVVKDDVGMLDTIFGATPEPEATEPAAEAEEPADAEPPEKPAEPEATEPVVEAEEPADAEPTDKPAEPEAAEPVVEAEEPADAEPPEKPAEPEASEPVVEVEEPADAEPPEKPAEPEAAEPVVDAEEPSDTEPADKPAEPEAAEPVVEAEEPSDVEPADKPEEPVAEEPEPVVAAPAPTSGRAEFTVHRPDPESLVAVEIHDGTLAVRQAYIIAMNAALTLQEPDKGSRLISGRGSIWLGQGDRVPVSIRLSEGMYARSDRMVLYDAGVELEPAELPGVPAFIRLKSTADTEVLFFAGGRVREVELVQGASVQVRATGLIAAGSDVEIAASPDSEDFVLLSGNGRIFISG